MSQENHADEVRISLRAHALASASRPSGVVNVATGVDNLPLIARATRRVGETVVGEGYLPASANAVEEMRDLGPLHLWMEAPSYFRRGKVRIWKTDCSDVDALRDACVDENAHDLALWGSAVAGVNAIRGASRVFRRITRYTRKMRRWFLAGDLTEQVLRESFGMLNRSESPPHSGWVESAEKTVDEVTLCAAHLAYLTADP